MLTSEEQLKHMCSLILFPSRKREVDAGLAQDILLPEGKDKAVPLSCHLRNSSSGDGTAASISPKDCRLVQGAQYLLWVAHINLLQKKQMAGELKGDVVVISPACQNLLEEASLYLLVGQSCQIRCFFDCCMAELFSRPLSKDYMSPICHIGMRSLKGDLSAPSLLADRLRPFTEQQLKLSRLRILPLLLDGSFFFHHARSRDDHDDHMF